MVEVKQEPKQAYKMPLAEAYGKSVMVLLAGVIIGFFAMVCAFLAMLAPGLLHPAYLIGVLFYACAITWVVLAVGVRMGAKKKMEEFGGVK